MTDELAFEKFEKESVYAIMAETEKLANVGGWEWDIVKDVWTFSDNWLRLHGCLDRHLKTDDLIPIAHPNDRAVIQAAFEKAVAEGVDYEIEHRIIRQDTGEERYIRAHGSPKLDDHGQTVKLCGSAQDITEYAKAKQLLQQNERRLKMSTESGGVGLWELNLNDRTAWRSLTHDQIFGFETLLPEWTYEMFLEHVVEKDRPMVERKFGSALKNKTLWDFQCKIRRKDGAVRWIHAQGKPEIDANQNPVKMTGTVQDITKKKRIEEELRVSEQKFRSLAENVPGLVLKYKRKPDGSDELLYISKTVEDIFEVSQRDCFKNNKLLWDRIHEDDLDEYLKSIQTSADNLTLWKQEHRLKLPGDRVKWLTSQGVPQQQNDGSVIWDTIALDITERKRAEQALYETSEALKEAQAVARIGSWWYDPVTKIPTWTDEMFHIFELEPQSDVPSYEEHRKIIHPDDWQRFDSAVSLAVTEGIGYDLELKITLPSGGIRYVNSRCKANRDESGKVIQLIGTTQDITETKNLLLQLEKRNTDLRLAQRIASIGTWTLDPEIGIPEWSDEIYRIYERDPKLGPYALAEYHNIYRGKYWQRFNSAIQGAINDGKPYDIELKLELPTGNVKWVHALCEPESVRGPEGRALRGTIQDITKHKETEIALRQNNYLLERITDNMFDLVSLADLEGKFTFAGKSHERVLGYAISELIGKNVMEFVHPDDIPEIGEKLAGLVQSDRIERAKFRYKHKEGHYLWFETVGELLRDENNAPDQIIFSTSDITERMKAETVLKENERRYKSAQRMGKVGNWEYDLVNETFWGSNQAKRIYGLDPESHTFTTDQVENCIPDRARVHQALVDLIEKNTPYNLEFDIQPITGPGTRTIRSIAEVLRDDSGRAVKVAGVIQDITDQKKALQDKEILERRLRQAQKMESIGTLAGGIAHDFNNILSSVLGFTELALDGVDKESPVRDDLQEVYAAGERAKNLVQQILTFARQSEEEMKPVQVDYIVKEVLKFIRSSIPTSIDIKQRLESESYIMGNATQLHQIMMNLCTNGGYRWNT